MSSKGFTHLHLHSQYSLLDGAIGFKKLLKRCKEQQSEAVAVTDHGNMFGAVEFYTEAHKAHIKPILGMEAYIAPASRFDKQKSSIKDAAYHLILLAQNNAGYKNLLKLSSAGFLEGFYYRPRIDKQILAECNEGLICTSACLKGEIASLLQQGNEAAAVDAADSFAKIFGEDRFFIEIQSHEDDDSNTRQRLIDLAEKKGLGLVATNDVHFLDEDDYEAHNCLCCISTGKTADDPTRMIYPKDIFLKSPAQMQQLFADVPQACDNTLAIARRCDVELDLKTRYAPRFKPDDGSNPEEFLTKLCYEKAEKLYGKITEPIKARLDRELDVIESKGFAGYFLINWDFCKYAHENNIPVGARGSGVGTIVGYCLGLCDIDPLKYDLLFERFMDPQRNEMPDIDIDICQVNRPKMIEYVRQKYGHVAQIITFGRMKARAAIRDICRVLDVPLSEADRLAKLVPDSLGMTLDKAMKTEPQLKDAYEKDERTKKVIDISRKLEGLARHASVHAAGIVIAEEPLTNFIPLYKSADHNLDRLGFDPDMLKLFKVVLSLPHGIVIVTGPTGSGKSTTLYSALNYLKDPTKNITTVEDPVEYRLRGINQIQIKPDIDLDFALCLRAILRQDPDIVLIGEIRDKETMEIAMKASLTGHLVLSTFHTNDAPSAISRLRYMGLEPYLLSSTINLVVAQRLIRGICPNCKTPCEIAPELIPRFALDPKRFENAVFYHGKGCRTCSHTGYLGRLPIFEFLMMDTDIRKTIVDSGTEAQIRVMSREKGYGSLLDSGFNKMLEGLTTADEILRVTFADNK